MRHKGIDKIKVVYWYLESLFAELVVRLLLGPGAGRKHKLPNRLVVSLTSYPPRFYKLELTVKCLLHQNVKPDLIILWVAYDDYTLLPESLVRLSKNDRFEIRECEDLKVYKKIIPALKQFSDAFLVTADDDLYYPRWWLSSLVNEWDGDFKHIVAHRVHGIELNKEGKPRPYKEWGFENTENTHPALFFPTGGGGVLFPPFSLHSDVTRKDRFMSLCDGADDIWLFWMARLNGVRITKSSRKFNVISWLGSQELALSHDNYTNNKNDIKIKNMIDAYGWPIVCK